MSMAEGRRRTLLEPGHEAEWAEINRVEAEQLRAGNMALAPVERLAVGQKLSQQAVELLSASVRAGHAPRRALWS
jgi:mannose/cellobiose epimerase-like protein (N-acyl-D-glucosamine 2-epimerase family)